MPLSKYKPQAKHLRRVFRRAAAAVRYRQSLKGVPALFANSFPKSGTHLLTQILHGFTQLGPAVASGLPAVVMFDGPTGQPRPTSTVLSDLSKLQPGDISYGHLHATPEIVGGLTRDGIAPFFILRDPRDVVVSHVHYVTEMEPNHVHHSFYKNELKDFEARLEVSILGRPELDVPFPDVHARFLPYMGWVTHPDVLVIYFENLVKRREVELGRIYDHAVSFGFPARFTREKAIEILAEGIAPEKSPTFRSGQVGKWREVFTKKHKYLFRMVAGDLLMQLGYERTRDW